MLSLRAVRPLADRATAAGHRRGPPWVVSARGITGRGPGLPVGGAGTIWRSWDDLAELGREAGTKGMAMPKAVRFDEYGGVDVLHVAEVPLPVPGPGQV